MMREIIKPGQRFGRLTVIERAAKNGRAGLRSRYSLDRIDNGGNYEPGNVRWTTQVEQMRNTRLSIRVVIDGQPLVLRDAAKACGLS
jgi:hypothetical protein